MERSVIFPAKNCPALFPASHLGPRLGSRLGKALAALALAFGLITNSAAAQEKRPPNILFIAVDDLRPSLGAYGDDFAITPNIDTLAQRSLVFDRAYVQMATCSPSRASLMSSLRPDTTGIYFSNLETKKVEDVVPIERTLNGFFKTAGYETVGIGKIYHTHEDSEEGWSTPVLDHWADRSIQLRGKSVEPETYLSWIGSGKSKPRPWEAGNVGDAGYVDGLNTLFAVMEMHRLAQSEKPFFLAVGIRKPHLPFNAPKKYWDLYDEALVPMPVRTGPPEKAAAYTMNNSGELHNYAGVGERGAEYSQSFIRLMNHGYYASVSYADAMVGKVLDTLEELNLDDNTIIVLWGDHGYKIGDYGAFNKHTNLEIDTRVPLMISLPENRNARRTNALVETIDLFPTLASLAGLEAPGDLHGESFEKLLENPDQDFKEVTLQQFYRSKNGKDVMGYAVRSKDFRYVAWMMTETGEADAIELYDLRGDLHEKVNVVNDPALAHIVMQMERIRRAKGHGPV